MISNPSNSPSKHNDTFDKQGGDSTSNEYYHLTEEEKNQALTPYDLPIASDTTLGGIKVGDNLTIDPDGTLNATGGGISDHNNLNGLQGGDSTSSEYYHLTEEKYNVVEDTSGTNTGDQVASDFNHNDLSNLNAGNYQHLTPAEKSQALSGGGTDFLVVQVFS